MSCSRNFDYSLSPFSRGAFVFNKASLSSLWEKRPRSDELKHTANFCDFSNGLHLSDELVIDFIDNAILLEIFLQTLKDY